MPSLSGVTGEGHARGAAAHHRDALGARGLRKVQFEFITGPRIHQAGRPLLFEHLVQTGLIAGDAGVDVRRAILRGLVDELRIGEQGPRHGDHVGIAARQDVFGDFGRVDAIRGDERNVHLALHGFGHPGVGSARHHGADGGHPRLVPANAGVDDRGARGLHRFGQPHDLFPGGSIGHQVQHGEAIDQYEVGPHRLASAPNDLHRKTHAVVIRAAPFIRPAIGAGHQELVDQVALATHDLHAVVARVLGVARAGHVIADGGLDPTA